MDRRTFLSIAGATGLEIGWGCLDPFDHRQPMPRIIPPALGLGRNAAVVAISQWPYGADAAAMVSADDLCPVDLGYPYDFGGSWESSAVASSGQLEGGVVDDFVFNELLDAYPRIQMSFFTITAMAEDPRSTGPLPESAPLSHSPAWCAEIRQLQERYPGFVLGWHGYSHYNSKDGSATEFLAYDDVKTAAALDKMEAEGAAANLDFSRAFRPPGWGITDALLEQLALRGFILADSSALRTFSGVRPGYVETASGQWLFRFGVTFGLTPSQVFEQGGLFVSHHHMTPPNVNALTDSAVRDELLRFVSTWYESQDPKIAWLSPDQIHSSYDQAAAIDWSATLDGSRVQIDVHNPRALAPGVTWRINSSVANDVEVYAAGAKVTIGVVERAGELKAYVI